MVGFLRQDPKRTWPLHVSQSLFCVHAEHTKAPFADAHRYAALTRPARSRLVCNYRSDGEISDDDLLYV
jgi:hypothetical protein